MTSAVDLPNWKKTFFLIWVGQAFSLVGSSLVGFAIIWWMTQTTGSATVLTTAALVSALPAVLLGPFIGALVDRWNRRLVMIVADTCIAVVTIGIVALFWSGRVEIWHLYLLSFVRSIGGQFHWTAMQASTSLMVPSAQLSRVAGLNQTLQGVLSVATPALGALLLGLLPMHFILSIDVVTAAIAVLPLLFVAIPQPKNAASAAVTPRAVLLDVREGFRYIWNWRGMAMVIGMAAVLNFLLNPAGTLMPLLVTKHFGGGVWHLGAVESAWSIGTILGGVTLGVWGGFKRRIVTSLAGIIILGFGALMIGLAPATAFGLAVAAQIILGMMNPMINGPIFALFQERIAPEMQGRVFTLVGSFAGMMAPLGLAIAGPIAERFGVQVWYWIGGIWCLLMGFGCFLITAIVHLEDAPSAASAMEPEPQPAP